MPDFTGGPQRDALGRILPGQRSLNPEGGRLHRASLTRALERRLRNNPEEVEHMVTALLEKAREGDLRAIELILDRIDGKPVQRIHETTESVADAIKRELLAEAEEAAG